MATMDGYDFADMIETTPVDTVVVEYREPAGPGGEPGRLVGACLTDKQSDGLSMVYSFYDSHAPGRAGMGTFMILDHVLRAAAVGMDYVYLGYWVKGSPSMDYKRRFHPLEALTGNGWRLLPRAPAPPAVAPERSADPMAGRSRLAIQR
jgi:arginine-tRNA-protein transferase